MSFQCIYSTQINSSATICRQTPHSVLKWQENSMLRSWLLNICPTQFTAQFTPGNIELPILHVIEYSVFSTSDRVTLHYRYIVCKLVIENKMYQFDSFQIKNNYVYGVKRMRIQNVQWRYPFLSGIWMWITSRWQPLSSGISF